MNKKFLLTIISLLVVLPSFVSATVADSVKKILYWQIPAPAYIVDSGYSGLPLWVTFLVFTLLFAILWLSSGTVPLFKAKENIASRKMFVAALALLVIFTTKAVFWIVKVINMFTALTIIALSIIGIYTIYVIARSNYADDKKINAESSKKISEAEVVESEVKKTKAGIRNQNDKLNQAQRYGLQYQSRKLREIEMDAEDVVTGLNRARPTLRKPTEKLGKTATDRIIRQLNDISVKLGTVLSYNTNNDRILSGMSNRAYVENPTGAPTLTGLEGNRIQISRNIDKQTNDLSHAINGLRAIIQMEDITGENINRLIEVSLNTVTILKRMQRDIPLESQMIERI